MGFHKSKAESISKLFASNYNLPVNKLKEETKSKNSMNKYKKTLPKTTPGRLSKRSQSYETNHFYMTVGNVEKTPSNNKEVDILEPISSIIEPSELSLNIIVDFKDSVLGKQIEFIDSNRRLLPCHCEESESIQMN